MEEQELRAIWSAYNKKLDKSLAINLQLVETIKTQKAEAKLKGFLRNQLIGIILGIAWVLFLGFLAYYGLHNPVFFISVIILLLFSAYATAAYIKHVVLISRINIADSITAAQEKLVLLQTSFHKTGRLLILQAPFYSTWFINSRMGTGGIIFSLFITALIAALSIWVYKNLHYGNSHKRWVRVMLGSFGDEKIRSAIAFLKEIEEFKKENQPG